MSSKKNPPLKVALVHDYLKEFGGAERVLIALKKIYPRASVYIAFLDQESLGIHWHHFADWQIYQTWLSKIPGISKIFSPLRVFAGQAFKQLDLSEYDLVISSSNAYMAKAVYVPNGVHICYCHTPPRALYGYSTLSDWKKNPLTRVVGELINHYMRVVDYYAAQRVDHFIANSHETARRIKKFYRRESVVIYPPVAIAEQLPWQNDCEYLLYVNRLALAKHPELAVQAATELGVPLKVVGSGPMLEQLQRQAGDTVEFLGAVSDQKLKQLYQGAQALLYPVEDEDFGIVPVEAMGFGVPVIAHNSGGPKESISVGKTGILFDELTVSGLKAALVEFNQKKWTLTQRKAIHKHALQFSEKVFAKRVKQFVEKTV